MLKYGSFSTTNDPNVVEVVMCGFEKHQDCIPLSKWKAEHRSSSHVCLKMLKGVPSVTK